MKHIPHKHFKAMPWKNGGGVTHEIAREGDGDDFLWRLSVAHVARSGAFSLFPHHHRILTVISGAGMRLEAQDTHYAADPLRPVYFAGREPINGQLRDGPCRDFNVIYNPKAVQASVVVLRGQQRVAGKQAAIVGLYFLSGQGVASTPTANQGDVLFLEKAEDEVTLPHDAEALLVTLKQNEF